MTNVPLVPGATPKQLEHAAALNHQEWFCLNARAVDGTVQEAEGVTWTYAGLEREASIPFPVLIGDRAGAQLDEIVAYYLRLNPKVVRLWSLEPPEPNDLSVRLFARGFQPSWRPCWMALDLQNVNTSHPRPEGLTVEADNETAIGDVKGLPYVSPDDATVCRRLAQQYPGRFQRFVALLDGKVVAHSVVLLTIGGYGVAGLYDVGVVPEARNQGIGKAVTLAACLYAKQCGYRYAVLNATGRRMYEQLGFRWIGDGWTWELNVPKLAASPPTSDQITLAEAIGRGDVEGLVHLANRFTDDDLKQPMTNGMTLMQLAVEAQQPASAEWLITHGLTLDALAAWDLGWKDRATQLLFDHREQVNQQYGEWGITLLHIAAQRDDVELAKVALSANPDLSQKDQVFQSTSLGWARHFHREEIIRLIEEHRAG